MTRLKFIQTYRAELAAHYDWAKDAVKLDRYMDSVIETLDGGTSWKFPVGGNPCA